MRQHWHWAITALSITGVILNVQQHWSGFAIWIVTNTCWCTINYRRQAYPQAALFAVYLGLAIWGLWRWRG